MTQDVAQSCRTSCFGQQSPDHSDSRPYYGSCGMTGSVTGLPGPVKGRGRAWKPGSGAWCPLFGQPGHNQLQSSMSEQARGRLAAIRVPPTAQGDVMARRDTGPDFIEALARGLEVIRAFRPRQPIMSLAAVAAAAGLARPTARRILLTLSELGYVRAADGGFELTPRVLDLGMCYVLSRGLWEVARPHLAALVERTHESSSIAQLDGSDIVYVARVAVPKIIALAVVIGTRFPAMQTSLGKVLLAGLSPDDAERVLAAPSRSGITARWQPRAAERAAALREVRARGWALTDEQLAPGIRS